MVKVAINPTHSGKDPLPEPAGWWARFNGSFVNMSLTLDQWATHIQAGHCTTTWHNKWRAGANFICGQHVGLDFDAGSLPAGTTLQDVLHCDPFISQYATILYTTSSHTPDKPRARVMFALDRPITDPQKYTLLARALLHHFNTADEKCKDACRLFYGAGGCDLLIPGRVLPLEAAGRELVQPYEDAQRAMIAARPVVQPVAAGNVPGWVLQDKADKLLAHLLTCPDGTKHNTLLAISRTFGGYVAGGYYSLAEVQDWLRAAIGTRSATVRNMAAAYRTIDSGLAYGQLDPLYFETRPAPPEPEVKQVDVAAVIDALPTRSPARAWIMAHAAPEPEPEPEPAAAGEAFVSNLQTKVTGGGGWSLWLPIDEWASLSAHQQRQIEQQAHEIAEQVPPTDNRPAFDMALELMIAQVTQTRPAGVTG